MSLIKNYCTHIYKNYIYFFAYRIWYVKKLKVDLDFRFVNQQKVKNRVWNKFFCAILQFLPCGVNTVNTLVLCISRIINIQAVLWQFLNKMSLIVNEGKLKWNVKKGWAIRKLISEYSELSDLFPQYILCSLIYFD